MRSAIRKSGIEDIKPVFLRGEKNFRNWNSATPSALSVHHSRLDDGQRDGGDSQRGEWLCVRGSAYNI